MIVLSAPALTALSQETVTIVQLILFQFSSGPLGLNTSNWDFVYGGVTYRGAYGLGTMSAIEDSPEEVKGLSFQLAGDSADMVALALDDSGTWQGTPIIVRTAILDSNFQIVEAPLAWTGEGDTMTIEEANDQTIVTATAESSATSLLRKRPLLYNDPDQQRLYPGDKGMEYMVSQADKPVVWPSKEWYYR